MAQKKISYWIISCDGCATDVRAERDGRPSGWGILNLERAAQDFQGNEVADASIRRLLCPECLEAVSSAINEAISRFEIKEKDASEA